MQREGTLIAREKNPANNGLDFIMGCLGFLGLIIQVIRQSENEINWKYFVGGFVAASIAGIILISACMAAIDDAVEDIGGDINGRGVRSCHYDAYTDTSIVISGNLGNSRSTYYQGDVCN